MIRVSEACLGDKELASIRRLLVEDGYLGMGQEVKLFEQELQEYISSRVNVACVNSGTAALHLSAQACGIGPGDEVIIPSMTFVATFQAVAATGAQPIACDIDLATGCIDVADARKCITSKTKAIILVHFAAERGDIKGVYDLADQYSLKVIEDAAHSFGSLYKGKPVGAEGDIICFSFDSIKNITCGEGGAVVSKDEKLIQAIRDLRLLGVEKDTEKRYLGQRSWDCEVKAQGWRYHMSNMNAALGRVQLKKINQFAKIRQNLAELYRKELSSTPLTFLNQSLHEVVPFIFVALVPEQLRDALKDYLSQQGIETGIHYKPNHLLEKFRKEDCPKAEQYWRQTLTLPLHCNLKEQDIKKISHYIREFFKQSV